MGDPYFTVGFIKDLVELRLWYAWHLVKVQGSSLADALAWTSFSGKCASPEDGNRPHGAVEWNHIRGDLEELLEAHGRCSDAFLESGMDLLWPHIEPAIAERTAVLDRRWEEGVVGCIRYEYPASKEKADSGDSVIIHFRNTMRPESPFHHRRALIESLQEVITRTGQTHPHVTHIETGTWLNSFPPFLSLFPQAWDESGREARPGGHMGWWGQFMDRKGTLHTRHAGIFKTRGEFLYRARSCRCSIELLESHLQRILGA